MLQQHFFDCYYSPNPSTKQLPSFANEAKCLVLLVHSCYGEPAETSKKKPAKAGCIDK